VVTEGPRPTGGGPVMDGQGGGPVTTGRDNQARHEARAAGPPACSRSIRVMRHAARATHRRNHGPWRQQPGCEPAAHAGAARGSLRAGSPSPYARAHGPCARAYTAGRFVPPDRHREPARDVVDRPVQARGRAETATRTAQETSRSDNQRLPNSNNGCATGD
jgi:hypothetical protein